MGIAHGIQVTSLAHETALETQVASLSLLLRFLCHRHVGKAPSSLGT